MKKILAIMIALVMAFSLVACASSSSTPEVKEEVSEDTAVEATEEKEVEEVASADNSEPAEAAMAEEEAAEARDAGTLQADPYTGYDYSDLNGRWTYSNYPNYKDFNEDGVLKVAFVCQCSGMWFSPKDQSMGETLTANGIEYQFIDANFDEQAWMDGVQSAINQEVDFIVLAPVNTELIADAVDKIQAAGIGYMTTDDPGPDAYEFYPPHYGLDDYGQYYQLGEIAAQKMEEKDFFAGTAGDYSDVTMIILDSPTFESIHGRDEGMLDGIRTKFPDLPDSSVDWLDCGAGMSDECAEKLSPAIQAHKETTKKWIFASGSGESVQPVVTLAQENGIAPEDYIFLEGVSTEDVAQVLRDDETESCVFIGLASAPSGVGIANLIMDLFKNGTPIPAFVPYEFIEVDHTNVDDFVSTYLK